MNKTTYEFIADRFIQLFHSIKNSNDIPEIKIGQLSVLSDAMKSLEIRADVAKQYSLTSRLKNVRADICTEMAVLAA